MIRYTEDKLVYEQDILIRSEQVDMTRRLRMSELFLMMEQASIAHTEELGCTREKTLDRGLLWIITRQEADILRMPCYDERITLRSWQGDMMHIFFPRFFEVEQNGEIIIRGRALWSLIDEESRQLIMPEDYDIFIPGRPGSDDMMLPPVIVPKELLNSPKDPGSETGLLIEEELVTRFSQLDINGHMNNTRYFDIIDDAVYAWRSEQNVMNDAAEDASGAAGRAAGAEGWTVPRRIFANYLSELKAGDRFALKGWRDAGGKFYFEGADGDKVRFRIACEY